MRNSKVISLLKSFSKKEMKEFGSFLNSPFFNNERVHIRLFEILSAYYPKFPDGKIGKKGIYAKIFPERNYNDGTMKNIISDFLQLELEFLRIKGLQTDVFYKEKILMSELIQRNEPALFNKIKRKAESALNTLHKNSEYFLNKLQLQGLNEFRQIREKGGFQLEPSHEENMLSFIILKILNINAKIINEHKERNISQNSFEPVLEEEITEYLEGKGRKYLETVYINCYYLMYKLLKTRDKKYFFLLKEALNLKHPEIDFISLRNLYTSIENYAVIEINKGVSEYFTELFSIYNSMIDLKLYLGHYGYMPHIFFLNTVSIALGAGETGWTEKFINERKDELHENYLENTYNMAMAILNYGKKDYAESKIFASKVLSDDILFKINIKSLYLKIYYDLNEHESFYSHIDTFKHFYKQNKRVSEQYRRLFMPYVALAKKLFDLKNREMKDNFEIQKIKTEISAANPLMNKIWLLEKAEELEGITAG